ncbi:MAG: hypothetical protein KAG61_01645 [Bacteriovoracaceae bacterium]|nr:hypothetical protein [Bacteriovoracaceae bacterium]
MEENNTPSYTIYKKSTSLRELANTIRNILNFLQEIALNTAINSNNNSSSTDVSVYQVIADEIKKNSDKMIEQLDEVDSLVNRLINTALDQLRYNQRVETFEKILIGRAITEGSASNREQVKKAIYGARLELLAAFKDIKKKVTSTSRHQSKLLALNEKLWLTVTSLKIENNLTNNTNVFFHQLSSVLDKQNEDLNTNIINIGKGLIEISEISKHQERSLV